jgi:triosephosphate isomerase
MSRRPLVVGNWKMNGTRASSMQLVADILAGLPGDARADVGVCPSAVFIPEVAAALAGKNVRLGAQNVADQDEGAYTGEISAAMLREFNCTLAIVGHSERRAIYGETDALVAARYAKAIAHGVTPILCVGETLEEREANATFKVVDQQMAAVLDLCGVESLKKAVIAYEPVWAIGTGRTATTEQAQEVHAYIRSQIAARDGGVADKLQILYGGSMKPDNAAALLSQPDVDGGLIGGASLDAKSFLAICLAA